MNGVKKKKLHSFLLSRSTVKGRVVEMSDAVLEQIANRVKRSPFYSIQLNECTEIVREPYLSMLYRCVSNDLCMRRPAILQIAAVAY